MPVFRKTMPVWHQNRGIRGLYGLGFPVPGYRLFVIWSDRWAVPVTASPFLDPFFWWGI